MLRGLAADVSWRRGRAASGPALRIALATALVLLVPLVGMQVSDGVDWGVADFVFAGALMWGTGLLLHQLATRRAGIVVHLALAAALGVAAIVLGEYDDAPGLVGFGLLLILGGPVLARRAARSQGG
jgi:hypothetical protein